MTRVGPRHVVTRVADVIVIVDEGQGTEVSLQMQDAARLVTALPYLLTGATGTQEVAAERLRHLRHHSRSSDLAGGPAHMGAMLEAAASYLLVGAAQCRALASQDSTRDIAADVAAGRVPAPEGFPSGWDWQPRVHPAANIVNGAALAAAVLDALNTLQAIGELQRQQQP